MGKVAEPQVLLPPNVMFKVQYRDRQFCSIFHFDFQNVQKHVEQVSKLVENSYRFLIVMLLFKCDFNI